MLASMLLAVDTSGMQGSLAILNGTAVVVDRTLLEGGVRHAQSLVAEVDKVLKTCGLKPHDIRTVAVSIGPGSFTGLRVGLVFAKTFAWLNDAQLVAVDTLRAITQQVPSDIECVTAIIDAQRSEYFAATYRWDTDPGLRTAMDDAKLARVEDLPREIPIVGPACGKLRTAAPDRFHILDESLWTPQATNVGLIGHHMAQLGQFSNPDTLEPVYIRLSYAEEKRRK